MSLSLLLGILGGVAVIFSKDVLKAIFAIMEKKKLNEEEVTIAKKEGSVETLEKNVASFKEKTEKEIKKDASTEEISDFFNNRNNPK